MLIISEIMYNIEAARPARYNTVQNKGKGATAVPIQSEILSWYHIQYVGALQYQFYLCASVNTHLCVHQCSNFEHRETCINTYKCNGITVLLCVAYGTKTEFLKL